MSDIKATGRFDAAFQILLQKHRAAYDELMEKFTLSDLEAMALQLPFDQQAADIVHGQRHGRMARKCTEIVFEGWVKLQPKYPPTPGWETRRKSDLALYCAAASQYAVSKLLTQVQLLKERELAIVQATQKLVDGALGRHCKALHASLVDHTQKKDAPDEDRVPDHEGDAQGHQGDHREGE